MSLYEKLNLAWKYLLLIVIVWAINGHSSAGRGHRSYGTMHGMSKMGGHGGMDWTSHGDMTKVRIEKNIIDGDTTITVIVNGEKLEVEKMWEEDGVQIITTTDGQTIKIGDGDSKKKKMIMKKKMMKN